jgi:small nuclear ribonucleoprotein (snRNP)-like protein
MANSEHLLPRLFMHIYFYREEKMSVAADQKERKRKESIVDLTGYLEKSIRVKFSGGREATGILKGFDPLLNLVLDDTVEHLRGIQYSIQLKLLLVVWVWGLVKAICRL